VLPQNVEAQGSSDFDQLQKTAWTRMAVGLFFICKPVVT